MDSDPFEFMQKVAAYVDGVFKHHLSQMLSGDVSGHPPVPLSFPTSLITDVEGIAHILAEAVTHPSKPSIA